MKRELAPEVFFSAGSHEKKTSEEAYK